MTRKLLFCFAAIMICMAQLSAQSPKRELRSTWLTTVWAIDWPKSTKEATAKNQMIECLDALHAHNYTGVCFQVRGLADAMYKSSYEPWSSSISGTRGSDPGWDPLAWVVEECHKRGMECYAWINPYRISSNGTGYSTSFDKEWKEKGWYLSNGSYIVFNPALAECRAHILKVIKEIYTNYAIDGMLFDDYFYPSGGMSEDSDAPDYNLFKESGTSLSFGDWRRKNINDFMKEIYENIQLDRPDMRFGISPAGVASRSASKYGFDKPNISASDWQYDQIYSDPLAWVADGYVDFISPQIYWKTNNSTAPFGPLTKWWSKFTEKYNRHFYASHSISFLASDNSTAGWADVAKQVTLHRDGCSNNAPGSIYYSTKNIDGNGGGVSGLGDYLEANVYTGKSLVPVITWKDRTVYAAPSDAKLSGSTLSWNATKGEGQSIIRYTVYAIPNSKLIENAMAADGDGIDGKYLLGVSYATTYELPSDKLSGYYYAVCVYDGYGYESQYTLVNYFTEPSTATTLISPNGDTLDDWSCTFKWNKVGDATYALEISATADFAKVLISKGNINTTETTLDISSLHGSTTYYWRIITTEPEKGGKASEAATFTTTKRATGNYEEGYTIATDPDSYDEGAYKLTSLWMRSNKSGFDNFPTLENGSLNRGMVATKDYVYLSGRESNSSSSAIHLAAYNATTGEHEFDLQLSNNGQVAYYPCNDVMKDSKGNVCISNLSLKISTTALKIHLVDLATGQLTEVASVTAGSGRIDHAAVYGDVPSGNFYVFAAASSSSLVYRWTITDGVAGYAEIMKIKELYPSSARTVGIAARVTPISENLVYVDGGTTATTLYDFSTGNIIDKPADGSIPAGSDYESNGQARFAFNGENFVVYAAGDDATGFTHNIASSPSENVLSEGTLLWTVPKATLGNVYSGTMSAPADAVVIDENEVRIYIYSSGNGIAAYSLTKGKTGITDIAADNNQMTIYTDVVTYAKPQAFIKAYNLSGILVASAENSAELKLPASGTYIIVSPSGAAKVAIR